MTSTSTYLELKSETEYRVLRLVNIVLFLINLTIAIIDVVKGGDVAVSWSLLGVSVLAFCTMKHFPTIWRLLIIASCASLLYVTILSTDALVDKHAPGTYFMLGYMVGIVEFVLVLSLKNVILKLTVLVAFCIIEFVKFHDSLDVGSSILIGLTIILCIIIYFYYDFLERRNFKKFYESREELRKFHSLLSNDFPTSVLIMSPDLKSILYSNSFFKQEFDISDQESSLTYLFQQIKINVDPEFYNLDDQHEDESNLYGFLQKFFSKSGTGEERETSTLIAVLEEEGSDKKFSYEIRLRAIIWDLNPAIAIVFNDVSDKQELLTRRLLDKQKDKIMNTLSHELKTPINGILGLLRIIKERVEDQQSQTYLEYCESCSSLLFYLVESILNMNLIQEDTIEVSKTSFNLDTLLEEIKSLYSFHAQERKLEFTIEKDPNVPRTIYTDRHRLIIILTNLLGNAFKFTFKGSVCLKVALDKDSLSKLKFSVIDTGIGIKEEEKAKMFKMLETCSEPKKNANSHGIGFGLSVTNALVKLLNDNDKNDILGFESVDQEGSTFYFKIDVQQSVELVIEEDSCSIVLKDSDLQEVVVASDLVAKKINTINSQAEDFRLLSTCNRIESRGFSTGRTKATCEGNEQVKIIAKNILVVDDNPFNILAVSSILQKFKCDISKAFNGEECLQKLEPTTIDASEHFDLILMDIQMPVLDGLEASKIITKRIQEGTMYKVPIVALTANKVDAKEKERYKQCGLLEVLEKPLKKEVLCKVLGGLGLELKE